MRSAFVVLCVALAPLLRAADVPPVTLGELDQVFGDLDRVIRSVVRASPPAVRATSGSSDRPATRFDAIARFGRVFDYTRPHFRFAPMPMPVDERTLARTVPADVRPIATRLVRWGFVAPLGALVAGPKDTLTPAELGDALGTFLSRLAELTHMPHPKWSPFLQGAEGFTPRPSRDRSAG